MNDFKFGKELRLLLKSFNEEIERVISSRGISATQFHILCYLEKRKEEDVTQKDLCEFLSLSAPTISITLNNMEASGLIQRTKSEADSRKTLVKLTEEGEKLAKEYKSVFREADERILSPLDGDEKEEFIRLLSKLNKEEEHA